MTPSSEMNRLDVIDPMIVSFGCRTPSLGAFTPVPKERAADRHVLEHFFPARLVDQRR
jgi:hypothetical protein